MGVIDVAIVSIIRRWHLPDQIPLREIARRLGISRNMAGAICVLAPPHRASRMAEPE